MSAPDVRAEATRPLANVPETPHRPYLTHHNSLLH